jgi:hypothetical protein
MKSFLFRSWKRVALLALVLGVVGAGVAWVNRTSLLTWYYLRQLASAEDADRAVWAERVATLESAAVPTLFRLLGGDDARACRNAGAALGRLTRRWGLDDSRTGELAEQLARALPRLSGWGRRTVLQLPLGWMQANPLPPALARAAGRMLAEAAALEDSGTCAAALELASALLQQPNLADPVDDCRTLVRAGLHDAAPANRLLAVQLASQPKVNLIQHVLPLLGDTAAEVRRAAILAAGSAPETEVRDEEVLRSLHDPDEDVRRICEALLRDNRRFTEEDLKLGRLLTDDRPLMRLQVLEYLHRSSDLEPGVWLRRLSHDPSPAVRAAALRTAAEQTVVDLTDRIDQMAQRDPSPTIRDQARHYLSRPKRRPPPTNDR